MAYETDIKDYTPAVLVFSAGGGSFTADGQITCDKGTIEYDSDNNIWVWWHDTYNFSEDMTVTFGNVPYNNETGLVPPEGMSSVVAWNVAAPYFEHRIITTNPDPGTFQYTIRKRDATTSAMVRRTFLPSWAPLRQAEQSVTLVTAGYPSLDFGYIQKITETYAATLWPKPIVCKGYSGAFCMDLGVTKQVTVNFLRTCGTWPKDPEHPTESECDDSSGNSKRWSNAKWVSEVKKVLDRWQMLSNGSRLYILRPDNPRLLSDDEQSSDPMHTYYTEICGERCYLTGVPVVYDENPQTISGSVTFAIGTVYPQRPEADTINIEFWESGTWGGDPGMTPDNPLTSIDTDWDGFDYLFGGESGVRYVANGASINIRNIDGIWEFYSSTPTINSHTPPVYGLSFNNDLGYYSLHGTATGTDVTLELYSIVEQYVSGPYTLVIGATLPVARHVDRTYPLVKYMLMPDATDVFGNISGSLMFTGSVSNCSVSGFINEGWRNADNTKTFQFKKVYPIEDLYYQGVYRAIAIGTALSSLASVKIFRPTSVNTDTDYTERSFTVTPMTGLGPNEIPILYIFAIGGGGGGGGADFPGTSNYSKPNIYGGGGGGSGSVASYSVVIASTQTVYVKCGRGGHGGTSGEVHIPAWSTTKNVVHGDPGENGLATSVTIGGLTVVRAEGGRGGHSGESSEEEYRGRGGVGFNEGGQGGTPGYDGDQASGQGNGGGGCAVLESGDLRAEYSFGGGGGGAKGWAGYNITSLVGFGTTAGSHGQAASHGTGTLVDNTITVHTQAAATDAIGWGGGGGGGGGYSTDHGSDSIATTEPIEWGKWAHDGRHGGAGWAILIASNAIIT